MLDYSCFDVSQRHLIDRLYEYDETIVYATMGSGKTACYLTAASELIDAGVINRVLIVAPLKPCLHVWAGEHKKWEHLEHLKIAVATGTADARKKAIESDAAIVVINIENLVWFLDNYKTHDFDALCIDELSKFSETGNKSVKKLRHRTKAFKHRVGLTGTPVHEGFTKLFAQTLVIDGGARYGKNKRKFLELYFYPTDYNEYNWEIRPDKEADLLGKLNGLLYVMPDYTGALPTLCERHVPVSLSYDVMREYADFAKHSVLELPRGVTIAAENAAVLSGKLEQFANGFVYDEDGGAHVVHNAKIPMLLQLVRECINAREQVIVFYQYQYEKAAIINEFTYAGMSHATLDEKRGIDTFLAGGVDVLLLHPKSAGHGLNLHTGGCARIICFAPIWSNDQHKQLVGRIWRRGQSRQVTVLSLVATGTIDEVKAKKLVDKGEYDKAFKRHVNEFK
jgi:SNF2 family DNA or RNA helicase